MLTLVDDRSLVVAVALVASLELHQMIYVMASVIVIHADLIGSRVGNRSRFSGYDADTGVHGRLLFHTGSHDRSLGKQKRNRLTLHVGSHERTGRVIVLKERNECRSDREYLSRGYIHIIKEASLVRLGLGSETTGNIMVYEMSVGCQRLVCLSHMIIILLISCHVDNLIGDNRIRRIL